MPLSRIVVVGASAGGFEAVREVLGGLPDEFPAAVLVVIHTGPSGVLPGAIARTSRLPVAVARDGERLQPGRVYVPPPDRHLTVQDGVVRVAVGPREHGFRPAIDPLFTTAAKAAGRRTAGVVLSGGLSDGTSGLHAIKLAGGFAVVQHPDEAPCPSMPLSALRSVAVDAVLPAGEIGPQLAEWAMNGSRRGRAGAHGRDGDRGRGRPTSRSRRPPPDEAPQLLAVTCPSCGGAISEVEDEGIARYECHVGHRFDAESLVAMGDERTEGTLWMAVRALQEQALLRRRMLERAQERGLAALASTWRQDAVDAEARADEIRRLIGAGPGARDPRLPAAGEARDRPNGRPHARRGAGRRSGEPAAVTREQARLSRELHQASRRKSGPAANRKAKRTSPRRT